MKRVSMVWRISLLLSLKRLHDLLRRLFHELYWQMLLCEGLRSKNHA